MYVLKTFVLPGRNMVDVKKVTIAVVEQCAPEEIAIVQEYKPDATHLRRRGPLDFGAEIAITLLTPVIWKVVAEFGDAVLKEFAGQSVKKLLAVILVKAAPSPDEAKTRDAIAAKVRNILKTAGVDDERREALAKSITQECLEAVARA